MATSQLWKAGALHLVGHEGFGPDFSDYFSVLGLDTTSCGAAASKLRVVRVPDVATSSIFAETQAGEEILRAGSQACTSFPLTDGAGRLLGMMSVHWREAAERNPAPFVPLVREVEYRLATATRRRASSDRGAERSRAVEEVRFNELVPESDAAARQWRRLVKFVEQQLAATNPMLESPLYPRYLVEMIAATALEVFPRSTMSSRHGATSGVAALVALRRAAVFIEAHVAEPITLADVASAAGMTARALQAAFRSHYATSFTVYLRRIRLEGVHRDLQAADPSTGATVAAIAARWGFSQAARLVDPYQRQYGVLPSQTLET